MSSLDPSGPSGVSGAPLSADAALNELLQSLRPSGPSQAELDSSNRATQTILEKVQSMYRESDQVNQQVMEEIKKLTFYTREVMNALRQMPAGAISTQPSSGATSVAPSATTTTQAATTTQTTAQTAAKTTTAPLTTTTPSTAPPFSFYRSLLSAFSRKRMGGGGSAAYTRRANERAAASTRMTRRR